MMENFLPENPNGMSEQNKKCPSSSTEPKKKSRKNQKHRKRVKVQNKKCSSSSEKPKKESPKDQNYRKRVKDCAEALERFFQIVTAEDLSEHLWEEVIRVVWSWTFEQRQAIIELDESAEKAKQILKLVRDATEQAKNIVEFTNSEFLPLQQEILATDYPQRGSVVGISVMEDQGSVKGEMRASLQPQDNYPDKLGSWLPKLQQFMDGGCAHLGSEGDIPLMEGEGLKEGQMWTFLKPQDYVKYQGLKNELSRIVAKVKKIQDSLAKPSQHPMNLSSSIPFCRLQNVFDNKDKHRKIKKQAYISLRVFFYACTNLVLRKPWEKAVILVNKKIEDAREGKDAATFTQKVNSTLALCAEAEGALSKFCAPQADQELLYTHCLKQHGVNSKAVVPDVDNEALQLKSPVGFIQNGPCSLTYKQKGNVVIPGVDSGALQLDSFLVGSIQNGQSSGTYNQEENVILGVDHEALELDSFPVGSIQNGQCFQTHMQEQNVVIPVRTSESSWFDYCPVGPVQIGPSFKPYEQQLDSFPVGFIQNGPSLIAYEQQVSRDFGIANSEALLLDYPVGLIQSRPSFVAYEQQENSVIPDVGSEALRLDSFTFGSFQNGPSSTSYEQQENVGILDVDNEALLLDSSTVGSIQLGPSRTYKHGGNFAISNVDSEALFLDSFGVGSIQNGQSSRPYMKEWNDMVLGDLQDPPEFADPAQQLDVVPLLESSEATGCSSEASSHVAAKPHGDNVRWLLDISELFPEIKDDGFLKLLLETAKSDNTHQELGASRRNKRRCNQLKKTPTEKKGKWLG